MRKWPGFCKELVNIFGAVKGLVKFFFHLLWPILEGRWIFCLIASFKHTWWRVVERNCRRKHKKAKACHPRTFVSSPEVLEFQGSMCTSCDWEGVKGDCFASLFSKLLEEDSFSRAMRPWWRICPFQGGLVLMTSALPRCYGLHTGVVDREKPSFLIPFLFLFLILHVNCSILWAEGASSDRDPPHLHYVAKAKGPKGH